MYESWNVLSPYRSDGLFSDGYQRKTLQEKNRRSKLNVSKLYPNHFERCGRFRFHQTHYHFLFLLSFKNKCRYSNNIYLVPIIGKLFSTCKISCTFVGALAVFSSREVVPTTKINWPIIFFVPSAHRISRPGPHVGLYREFSTPLIFVCLA